MRNAGVRPIGINPSIPDSLLETFQAGRNFVEDQNKIFTLDLVKDKDFITFLSNPDLGITEARLIAREISVFIQVPYIGEIGLPLLDH